jgi:hypothetical protein
MKVKELVQLLIELPPEADEVEIYFPYDGPETYSRMNIGGIMYDGESVLIVETEPSDD